MSVESQAPPATRTRTLAAVMVAAMIPAVAYLSLSGSLAWGGALLVGALLASDRPLRWVAVAWCVAAIAPDASLPESASSGSMVRPWSPHLLAAVLGISLTVVLPTELRNSGFLLLVVGLVTALHGRGR